MPLLLLNVGEHAVIKRIGGKPEVKQHLSDLGFIVGASILVVSKLGDNLIVNIKNSRIALDRGMAKSIFI
ncbi:MAG: ferrous iron transport protein A [Spirochaetaceae bacterium]|nr:ferrous iron transport protein A [Spirochaetaceae bacterium]